MITVAMACLTHVSIWLRLIWRCPISASLRSSGSFAPNSTACLRARWVGTVGPMPQRCFPPEHTSCPQCYGEQKLAGDPKAADVELLLRLFPGVAVAFIERTSTTSGRDFANGENGTGEDIYHSVKICSDAEGRISEAHRIR